PTTISRLIAARGGRRPVIARNRARNGQTRIDAIAIRIVVKTTRNDESTAKPAPGPMYASARAGASTRASAVSTIARVKTTLADRRRRIRMMIGIVVVVYTTPMNSPSTRTEAGAP